MKPPALGIRLSQPHLLGDDGCENPLPFQDIEIAGNREGLLRLAELVRRVAESGDAGFHTHIYPDDSEKLLRSEEFSITIALNSTK
jgi:hypothetical protein